MAPIVRLKPVNHTAMKTILNYILTASALLASAILGAQEYSATVIDSKTGDPIPFATVQTGEHSGTVTNSEGVFSISESQVARLKDSIFISSMGYSKVGILVGPDSPTTLSLDPKTIELGSVFISANPLEVKEIIAKVKENMDNNYKVPMTKKKVFFRLTDNTNMQEMKFKVEKSTIAELNQGLIDSVTRAVPTNSVYYHEMVGDFYGDYNAQKLYIDKAAELYDKNNDVGIDNLNEKLERIFKENVKPDSYLKIKSGVFGTKLELDSVATAEGQDAPKENVSRESNFQEQMKGHINTVYEQLFFHDDSELDMLDKSNRYRFELDEYTYINDQPVYVINFTPKGKKDFKGTMYVDPLDFAIVRLDFNNVRPIGKFGLFGITYRHHVFRGKMLFAKDASGSYAPSYLELEDGELVGVDRPLKVIEKNKNVKGRRKQNELDMDIVVKVATVTKYELVFFSSEQLTTSGFDAAQENPKVEATYLSAYDPAFWEGYTIMEPNAAIQAFRVME